MDGMGKLLRILRRRIKNEDSILRLPAIRQRLRRRYVGRIRELQPTAMCDVDELVRLDRLQCGLRTRFQVEKQNVLRWHFDQRNGIR